MTARLRAVTSVLRGLSPRAFFVESEVAGLGAVVRPGDVCVDIGAEYGLYTFPLAELVGRRGRVYGVEPLPGPAAFLTAGARVLGARNVRILRRALGRQRGSGTMSLPVRRGLPVHGRAFLTTGASGPGPNVEFHAERRVQARVSTLDALVAEHGIDRVDFVKIDVEGNEAAVLDGGAGTLSRHRPTVLMEVEPRHLAKYGEGSAALAARLRHLGYGMRVWTGRVWSPAAGVRPDRRNYLFVANGEGGEGGR